MEEIIDEIQQDGIHQKHLMHMLEQLEVLELLIILLIGQMARIGIVNSNHHH